MNSGMQTLAGLAVLARLALAHDLYNDILTPSLFGQCRYNGDDLLRYQIDHSCPFPISEDTSPDPSTWHPWTHRPYCANSTYCVFTNSLFQGSQGISIISTPETAARSLDIIETAFSTPNQELSDPPYVVRDVPGKGKGVIATRLISKGEVFMVDYAAVIADVSFPGRVKRGQGQKLLETAMLQLPNPERVLDLATSGKPGTPLAEDVLRTNTFSATLDETPYMALFPNISRMNHACNPNAFTRFSERALSMRAVAFRDISEGEEISISYSEFGLTYPERQFQLKHRWGFRCTCDLCSRPPEERAASDSRRNKIAELRQKVLKLVEKSKFHSAIKLNEELLALTEKEELVSHLGEHYEVMARMHYAVRDMKNAKRYGKLALADLRQYGGPDVYDSIKEMQDLFER